MYDLLYSTRKSQYAENDEQGQCMTSDDTHLWDNGLQSGVSVQPMKLLSAGPTTTLGALNPQCGPAA